MPLSRNVSYYSGVTLEDIMGSFFQLDALDVFILPLITSSILSARPSLHVPESRS